MEHVRETLGPDRISERRACRVLGQSRSTQRRTRHVPEDEPRLIRRIIDLATRYVRYGYRRITMMLREEGWGVNHKRIERLWRQEGLKVPGKQPQRRRLWLNDGSCVRLRPQHRDHVWSCDFVFSQTDDGRPVRLLTLIDEFTRECLVIDVARRLTSEDVLERLSDLFIQRGTPDGLHPIGQWSGIHGSSSAGLAGEYGSEDSVHRTRQPVGERLHRVIQRKAA